MEDAVSRSSLDSSSTGDEFVVVHADPKFKVTGDFHDLEGEVCGDGGQILTSAMSANNDAAPDMLSQSGDGSDRPAGLMSQSVSDGCFDHVIPSSQSANILSGEMQNSLNGATGIAGGMSASLYVEGTSKCGDQMLYYLYYIYRESLKHIGRN
jgi:hypothetical protein